MLSIVIPVLNESDSLRQLHEEISHTCAEHKIEREILFIDDGSSDDSWKVIEELARQDSQVTGIRFRRNFGKAAALTVGMRNAHGDLIMMMDADLQDNPKEIPAFLEKIDEGYDVVNGWKETRHDPWHKVYPSRIFNWMVSSLTGLKLHDHNCGFKLFRSEVPREIRIYGELHRFVPVLAHAKGFKVAEITVHHRARQFGHSKYGLRRFLRGFLDLLTVKFLTGFGQRPQHMLGAVGLLFFGIGVLGTMYMGLIWLLMNLFGVIDVQPIGSRPLLAYSLASTLLGAQAMTLGLLAELIVAYTGREADTFSIAETIGPQEASAETPA